MARVRAKLRELKEADAQFVSLVARGANRIPFRIVKKDKEHSMIDLTSIGRVFKREADQRAAALAAQVPQVAALVVMKGETPVMEAVKKAFADNGFSVEKSVENADGSVMFAQMDDPEVDSVAVRVSPNLVAVLKNSKLEGPVVDAVAPVLITSAEMKEWAAKLEQVEGDVPESVWTAAKQIDDAMVEIAKTQSSALTNSPIEDVNSERTPGADTTGADGVAADTVVDAARAAQGSKELNAPEGFDSAVWDGLNEKQKLAVLTAVGKKAEPVAEVQKVDVAVVVSEALAPVLASIQNLSTTLEGVITTQKAQSEVVKTLSEKSEQVEKVVKGTVVAPARAGDQPAGGTREVQKSEDPRSGCFDTAFLPKK